VDQRVVGPCFHLGSRRSNSRAFRNEKVSFRMSDDYVFYHHDMLHTNHSLCKIYTATGHLRGLAPHPSHVNQCRASMALFFWVRLSLLMLRFGEALG
jgi:hypothetical protein